MGIYAYSKGTGKFAGLTPSFVSELIVGESNYGLIINVATVALVLALFVVVFPTRVLDSEA